MQTRPGRKGDVKNSSVNAAIKTDLPRARPTQRLINDGVVQNCIEREKPAGQERFYRKVEQKKKNKIKTLHRTHEPETSKKRGVIRKESRCLI